jgi:rubrerythrin
MDLLEALVQGMKLERDGYEFYTRMADRFEDADTKAMFSQLAADEVDHLNFIKRQYDALGEGKGWSAIPEMELVDAVDAVSVVFPPDKVALEELSAEPSEEDALLFALAVEDKSFKLYYNSTGIAKDKEAKNLFMQLAGAEQTHFEVLMQRYDALFGYPG